MCVRAARVPHAPRRAARTGATRVSMHGGGGGGGSWSTLRSFSRDGKVAQQKLAPGTVGRIGRFARPYKRSIGIFLVTVVVDALLKVSIPVMFGWIVTAITQQQRTTVTVLAGIVAFVYLADTIITLVGRWYSARIGEGLIFDLRREVFSHVQRMPVAFFTRTQTGALISRLNNDVIGAQQAFTSTLSGVV